MRLAVRPRLVGRVAGVVEMAAFQPIEAGLNSKQSKALASATLCFGFFASCVASYLYLPSLF